MTNGGCFCGAVRFEVTGAPFWKVICHCKSCRHTAGALAMAWTGFNKPQFTLLRGEPAIYESSPGVLRGFCSRCGTTLTYERQPKTGVAVLNARPGELYVATITFDDPTVYPPDEHIWYGDRVPWFHVAEDLPCHESLSATQSHRQRLGPRQERGA
ncbi:MAG: GFA family protein [Acidiferrobacterales bacterium]